VKEYTSDAFNNFVKKAQERGKELTQPTAGATFSLGSAQVTVIGPVGEYNDNNNRSIVLRIVYGETSFLFTGDAEREAETDILASGAMLKSTVLKVGHHGSESSTTYPFLRAVDPDYAVISAGKDNKYGHPTEDVLSRLRDAEVKVYRTDMQGDIVCTSDGKTVTFQTQKNGDAITNPTEKDTAESSAVTDTAVTYIGNVKSKKYHLPTCSSLPAEENRIIFSSKQEAIDAEYEACGSCKP
jgi:competence protein ComEC